MEDREKALRFMTDGDWQSAIGIFTKILQEDPTDLDALCNIGISYTESCDYSKAVKALSWYNTLNPDNPDVHEALGCCYFRVKEFQTSYNCFSKTLELNPLHASGLRNMGVLCGMMGKNKTGYEYLKQSASLNPGDYRTLFALANAHLFFEEYEEADKVLIELNQMNLPSDVAGKVNEMIILLNRRSRSQKSPAGLF